MSETAILKAKAKMQLEGNWGTMALILLIDLGIALVSGILVAFLGIIGTILSVFISTWSILAWRNVSVMVARGEPITVRDAFRIMPRLPSATWTNFLSSLFISLWALLTMVPALIFAFLFHNPLAIFLLFPAMSLPMIKAYAYSQAFCIMLDDPYVSGTEPITRSRELMDGHKWELFWLELTFLGWGLLTALTFGLLSFYTVPYMNVTYANFYLELTTGTARRSTTNAPMPTSSTQNQWRDMAP